MDISITFGWWLAPAAVTVASFWMAWRNQDRESRGGSFDMTPLFNGIIYLLALIPSLIAWLIWAVLT